MDKFSSVDAYIDAQDPAVAERLKAIRKLFHEVLPGTEESIRYDMPAFTVGERHLYMAGYKNHIGMYPMYGVPELADELDAYRGKGTKDTMRIEHSEPLPLDLIEKVIRAKSS